MSISAVQQICCRTCLFVLAIFSDTFRLDAQENINFLPGPLPVVFGPGNISDGFNNRDLALSPDNSEMFFTIQSANAIGFSAILHSRRKGKRWTKPEVAIFSGVSSDLEPAFSPDGRQLFFSSNRPGAGTPDSLKDYNIWVINRTNDGWSPPVSCGPLINTVKNEFYPSVTSGGRLYFTRETDDAKDDIFYSQKNNAGYAAAVRAPAINSDGFDFNAYVDPQERFILFSSYHRTDDLGGGDLYVSLRNDSSWSVPRHLEAPVSSAALDYSPFVSFDGRLFFFTSRRTATMENKPEKYRLDTLHHWFSSPGNGSDDIYFMSFDELSHNWQLKN